MVEQPLISALRAEVRRPSRRTGASDTCILLSCRDCEKRVSVGPLLRASFFILPGGGDGCGPGASGSAVLLLPFE